MRDTIAELVFEQTFENNSGFAIAETEYLFPIEFWSVISSVMFQVGSREEVVSRVITKEEAIKNCNQ